MPHTCLEIFRSSCGSVAKFVHPDGSETAIKSVLSQSTFVDPETKRVDVRFADRQKFSIFLSVSTGCFLKCPFCHLTIKDSVFRRLSTIQLLANAKAAVAAELAARPELAQRYVKICWMGMGDGLAQPLAVKAVTIALLDWMLENNYTIGLDSVDLSTVMPAVSDLWIATFAQLNHLLSKYPLNPASHQIEQAELSSQTHYTTRSRFRLFYSLHSALQETRDRMCPNTLPLARAIPKLQTIQAAGVSVLLHQVFVEGLNDSMAEVDALVALLAWEFPDVELRVLRYNFCDKSPYQEWAEIIPQLGKLLESHKRLKIQTSAGSEVQAACGQFLVAFPRGYSPKVHC